MEKTAPRRALQMAVNVTVSRWRASACCPDANQPGAGLCYGWPMNAPTDAQATIAEYDSALHQMLDENEALRAERDQLRTEIDRLVSWIMATTTRCTAC